MNALGDRAASLAIGLATAIVVVAVAIVPFLTPQWVGFEQGRSNAVGWTGYSAAELARVTDRILADLVVGPPAFDVEVAAVPVLNERERGHMRDVRTVFLGLWALSAASLAVLAVATRRRDRRGTWRAVRRGALGLMIGLGVVGLIALVAFDALFELFHQVFFPAGSYTFDPSTERLVQLFPFRFWQETAVAVGVVILGIAMALAAVARRRSGRSEKAVRDAADRDLAALPEPGR